MNSRTLSGIFFLACLGPAVVAAEGGYPTVDCGAATSACQAIAIHGDPPFHPSSGLGGAFSGYADPCVRRDLGGSTLWLGYSWPHTKTKAGASSPAVEIHLARSDDDGRSWRFAKALWPATWAVDQRDGMPGIIFKEAVNLCPVVVQDGTVWYAANLSYFYGGAGGARKPRLDSFVIQVRRAGSVEALADAVPAVLGSAFTARSWKPEVDLSSLDPSLADVTAWNEPALWFENGRLYLALVSFVYDRATGEAKMERNRIHVFSTVPADPDPRRWTWAYRGVLAGPAEARELGAERLTQAEITRGRDGSLLLLATPDDWVSDLRDYNHKGCVVLQIASLERPALTRGTDGRLVIRARVTASDSGSLGSAASSYEASFPGGLLFTKRQKSAAEFTIGFYATGLHP